ncbi:hypothetical protein D3C79_656490 [compost metagenome]
MLPGCEVKFRQLAAYLHTLSAGQLRAATAKHQFATALVEFVHGRGIEHVGDIGVADAEPPFRPLQGHAELTVAGFFGGLAEGCRQVDGQPLETGVDLELIVSATQIELQLIRQLAG